MNLLDLIFPPRCAGCEGYGDAWCPRCAAAVERLELASLNGTPLVAGGRFTGPLQQAIHTYKYRGRKGLAARLATTLVRAVPRAGLALSALTYIPLHADRERERGFNQAQAIAAVLGKALGLPVVGGLERVRATPAQVGLGQAERWQNLLGGFAWRGGMAPPEGLGLVDDVCTTGATLEAASQAIRGAGGSVAAFLVLARAQTLPAAAVTLPEQTACF